MLGNYSVDAVLTGGTPTGEEELEIQPPTEAEWEKGARGTEGLIYPWGDIFDKDKCSTKERGK